MNLRNIICQIKKKKAGGALLELVRKDQRELTWQVTTAKIRMTEDVFKLCARVQAS